METRDRMTDLERRRQLEELLVEGQEKVIIAVVSLWSLPAPF